MTFGSAWMDSSSGEWPTLRTSNALANMCQSGSEMVISDVRPSGRRVQFATRQRL